MISHRPKSKQMFECLVLSSYHKQGIHVVRAEAPPHERDLAS